MKNLLPTVIFSLALFLYTDTHAQSLAVARVISHKAEIRTGPSDQFTPFSVVPRGTRLVVEDTQGAWYKVISPQGTRGWIIASSTTPDGWVPSKRFQFDTQNPSIVPTPRDSLSPPPRSTIHKWGDWTYFFVPL